MMKRSARTAAGPPPEITAGYDEDFYVWTQEQAAALRYAAAAGLKGGSHLDWEHLAEEIEDMGKRDRRALESDLARIVEHLLKLERSPAVDPVPGWRDTVREH